MRHASAMAKGWSSLRQLHAIVQGHVQGVSFRYNAQHEAQRLALTGWVRNRADGTVETVATGSDDALDQYATWLRRGPTGAHVTDVEITWGNTNETFTAFEIRYGAD